MLEPSPTKVIQVGDNAQNRVAQACDRCRRKKIRCDGKRPCCTQCANVGFECVTSDKLSRRAFPRGYTESLEAKVRSLQAELRQLRNPAGESSYESSLMTSESKDEHCGQHLVPWPLRSIPEIGESSALDEDRTPSPRASFNMMPPSPGCEMKAYRYRGLSSVRGLIDVFKCQHTGKTRFGSNTNHNDSFSVPVRPHEDQSANSGAGWSTVSAETCKMLVSKYFEDWNCLFPILDRSDMETSCEDSSIAQKKRQHTNGLVLKHLVLSVGSLSTDSADRDPDPYESQWRDALTTMIGSDELMTLQCLLLAQLFCINKGHVEDLLFYQNSATALIFRLSLHRSQNAEKISLENRELRKRLFWTQYTVHCFSAAFLGQDVIFNEYAIQCEYPSFSMIGNHVNELSHVNDANPSTVSLASLALFKLARILSRVLQENYSILGPHCETTLESTPIAEELSSWLSDFTAEFSCDGVMGDGANKTFLTMHTMYHYTQSLLHRPIIIPCGEVDQSSTSLFEESCRTSIRDMKCLKDNAIAFSMCIRSEDILLNAGVGLIMQQTNSLMSKKITQEHQKLIKIATEMLESRSPRKAFELTRLAELTKPRSSLKRSKSLADQAEINNEPLVGSNKIRKTKKAIDTTTSFESPEITTPIKAENVFSNSLLNSKNTKLPKKLTMRRISTVQSEPSHSPIRSSPVKRMLRNTRKHSTHAHDVDSQYNAYSSQPVPPLVRTAASDMDTLRVDISAAQWVGSGNFITTPSDHSSTTMSASFNGHEYGFYNNSYDNNPTSAPHNNTFSTDIKANGDIFNNTNNTSNSFMRAQHTSVHNPSVAAIDVSLMTPTDELDPSWNTPSSIWEGSPARGQLPVSAFTNDCSNNNMGNINHGNGNASINVSACMNNIYPSHQIDHHQRPPHQHHQHPGLIEMHEGYPQGENCVPGMPVPTVVSPLGTTAAEASYHHSMMMAAATGAYGHLNTP